jgi:hypothetical protein
LCLGLASSISVWLEPALPARHRDCSSAPTRSRPLAGHIVQIQFTSSVRKYLLDPSACDIPKISNFQKSSSHSTKFQNFIADQPHPYTKTLATHTLAKVILWNLFCNDSQEGNMPPTKNILSPLATTFYFYRKHETFFMTEN